MKNVSLMCTLILQGECEKIVQTFNMFKRSDVNPTNQPETT